MVIGIDIQGPAIFAQKFRFPKQLVDFSVEKSELEQSFHQIMPEQPATIEIWGESFEQVVRHALLQRNPPQHLPASYKGRCKQPKLVKTPMMSPVRKASNGEFNPSFEVVAFSSRRKVKQLRRLQSLCQRIHKFGKYGALTTHTCHGVPAISFWACRWSIHTAP